jgi:hypothetical protein
MGIDLPIDWQEEGSCLYRTRRLNFETHLPVPDREDGPNLSRPSRVRA